jgi:hypothetical protein
MATVKGINERVHLPLYDSLFVRPERPLKELLNSNVLKFFVNIRGKTKLETNMQSPALLPHWNTFEARALRVVFSDLPDTHLRVEQSCTTETNGNGPKFDACLKDLAALLDDCNEETLTHEQVTAARESVKTLRYSIVQASGPAKDNEDCLGILRSFCDPKGMGQILQLLGDLRSNRDDLITVLSRSKVTVNNEKSLRKFIEELEHLETKGAERRLFRLLDRAKECLDEFVKLTDLGARLKAQNLAEIEACIGAAENLLTSVKYRTDRCQHLKQCFHDLATELGQLKTQVKHGISGQILGKLIYNSVTTLFVGEKIMIQMPTWFFPAGAGPYSDNGQAVTHGFPTPQATFHFAEPVSIDAKQPFRVEIEIPEANVLEDLQRIYGPFFIWVVLDGYMTRDVQ